jgi:hypothetical protein
MPAEPVPGDIAAVVEPEIGPTPAVRALIGLLLGLACGALAALLTPRAGRGVRAAPLSAVPDRFGTSGG